MAKQDDVIRAAGGVVWDGDGRVAVIHRPRYDDWSLPKGKCDNGEAWLDAALREVWEEIGCRCIPGAYAGSLHYTVKGRDKVVAFWHMTIDAPAPFEVNEEVDELRWLAFEQAVALLSQDNEKKLLADAYFSRGDA